MFLTYPELILALQGYSTSIKPPSTRQSSDWPPFLLLLGEVLGLFAYAESRAHNSISGTYLPHLKGIARTSPKEVALGDSYMISKKYSRNLATP